MKRGLPFTLFFFLSFLCAGVQAQTTYALIVGVEKYSHPYIKQLKYAVDDAKDFREMLMSNAGGNVKPENIKPFYNEQAVSKKITDMFTSMKRLTKQGDRFIFYFSGHGDSEHNRELMYLLTYDATYKTDTTSHEGNSINVAFLKSGFKELLAKGVEVLFITDACRSNEQSEENKLGIRYNNVMETGAGEIMLNSCLANQKSEEDYAYGHGHGVFTWYLMQGWMGLANADNDDKISYSELFSYVKNKVDTATYDVGMKRSRQSPFTCCDNQQNNVVSNINQEILEKLRMVKSGHKDTSDIIAYITTKNASTVYDEDSITMRLYNKLMGAVADGKILYPSDSCAYSYYVELKKRADGRPIFIEAESELVAGLYHNGQEILTSYFEGNISQLNANLYKTAYQYMSKALEIIDKDDYNYKYFKSKALFLESQSLMFRIDTRRLAFEKIDSAIQMNRGDAYLYYAKGLIYTKYLNDDSAIVNFEKAISLAPGWAGPYIEKSYILRTHSKKTESINCMEQLIENTASSDNHIVLGDFYFSLEDFQKSIKHYNQAIKIDSMEVKAYDGLAACYRHQLNDSLYRYYTTVSGRLTVNNDQTNGSDAAYYEVTENYKTAAEKYKYLYLQDTSHLYYYVKYGEMLYKQGGLRQEGINVLKNAIEWDPYFLDTYRIVIAMLEGEGQYEYSIKYHKFLLDVAADYNPSQLYHTYISLYQLKNDEAYKDSALYYLELGEKKFPEERFTKECRTEYLVSNGMYTEAIASLNSMVKDSIFSVYIYDALAYCYDKLDSGYECVDNMQKCLEMGYYDVKKYPTMINYLLKYKYSNDIIVTYLWYPFKNDFGFYSDDYLGYAAAVLLFMNETEHLPVLCKYGIENEPYDYNYLFYYALYNWSIGNKKEFYNYFEKAMKIGLYCDRLTLFSKLLPDPNKEKKYQQMSRKLCK